ncbi:MAG: hypothetical protein QG604_280, partial [Candidatus Dependentiae bacterium]|nr:hypothetical protein [Candidatus Dependentiae bacterium]
GKFSTDVMYNTIKTRHTKIPMISAGVPVGYNDTPPEIMQANTPLTAVSTQLDWPEKIGFLKKILPYAKNVLIIFRSIDEMSHNNLKEKNTITASLRKVHIAWKMHHVSNIEKNSDLSAQLLEGVDIIVLSRSSEILRHASRIASEAAQFNVPVFSSDINCPDVFIAISECPERAIGIQSAKYAIEVLEDGVNASDLPLKEIRDRKKIFIHPHTTSPIIATTAIGNLLSHCNHINITIAPARLETKNS